MHDAKATSKIYLSGDESIGSWLSKQRLRGSKTFRTNIARIWQRNAGTRMDHISQATNAEWVAFADKQRHTAIPTEEARLRLDHAHLMQLPQGLWVAHEDIRIETRGTADLEREVAKRNCSGANHLDKDGLRQCDQNDVG
ncbi:hypothetical protein GCM10007857_82700 [Bradyrhizobium iriomotense]|uniref:Uncharacterized protein n=1 Tax=Bradyrhizobium iriomotense TaxID=441950 RepID=A0ABQ6BB15_9BRAD|nr:hypothetical protein GCM10007857_82700 [Bradyrhizobium iriomotense]